MNPGITKIIDQYLSNELSTTDRQIFEERLEKSPELQKEVELQRDVIEGVKRATQRTDIKKTKRNYHRSKLLKWGVISLSSFALLGLISYLTFSYFNNRIEPISEELIVLMDKDAQFDNLQAQYYQMSADGGVVLTENGVLLSIPENAFLKDGQPYQGATIIQFQEALDAEDIVTSGLSTMSGDRLLETQGMFSLRSYTKNGEELEINPDVGVYVQAPVDEYKSGMQLFEGEKGQNGLIDWENPEPLRKIPVPIDMSDLDFYPEKYEPYLDGLKWNQSKQSRDSLYLSFEDYYEEPAINIDELFFYLTDSLASLEQESDVAMDVSSASATADAPSDPNYILPSKVLGFWNKKFNHTNLSTRAFEQRMRSIHNTCNNKVLDKYVRQLNKPLSIIDKEVVAMGYPQFEVFVAENMGKVNVNNPHLKHLQSFYEKAVKQLKKKNKSLQDKDKKRKQNWDNNIRQERKNESTRKLYRESQALQEEYEFNMKNVKRQIGPTVGFTIKHGGGTVYNIDKYVWDATVNRESMDRIDPVSGKRVKITYNDFSFNIQNPDKYIKLFAYIFPHQINSYQRLEGKNGKFSYPLNDDMIYDIAVVGITEDGYEYFQKMTFKKGELGSLTLKQVSEDKMKASIKQLNRKRITKPMRINAELEWLIKERKDFKEQKLRKKMDVFRQEIGGRICPCTDVSESQAIRLS
ncbi:MAG: hypothetical protein HRT58_21770 [Crocinitomicaceae bacterium]|nr:hypothetical protein [Flavobacteriales bacterium]NQZ38303.1 hypothetical protein [Crocinitomicaceae bacterium]